MGFEFISYRFISLYSRASTGGLLIFVDANEMSIMQKQEHPDLSDVEWDPTGRYVATSVNLWNAKVYLKKFFNFYVI
jgi:translation initiation factor 3 subunit B